MAPKEGTCGVKKNKQKLLGIFKNITANKALFLIITQKCPMCGTAGGKKYIVKKPTSLLLYISLHT